MTVLDYILFTHYNSTITAIKNAYFVDRLFSAHARSSSPLVYIYVCVCVCVCFIVWRSWDTLPILSFADIGSRSIIWKINY